MRRVGKFPFHGTVVQGLGNGKPAHQILLFQNLLNGDIKDL